MAPEQDSPPPFWEALSTTREQMARIETKLDMVLSQQALVMTDLDLVKTKTAELEAGRSANSAGIATAKAEASAAREMINAYDISPTQFHLWKEKVDKVVEAFGNTAIAVKTKAQLRAQDWALLCGVATVIGAILGNIPTLIGLFGFIGIGILGAIL